MRSANSGQPTVKLHYFPLPYPDEIIGSVQIRACRHFGLSMKRFSHEVLGRRSNHFPMQVSSHLRLLAEMTGLDAPQLLERHTIVPYITAFLPTKLVNDVKRSLLTELPDGLKPFAALIQSATTSKLGWRYCPACAKLETRILGESYWHRTHLLPGVLICERHSQILHHAMATMHDALALPNEVSGCSLVAQISLEKLTLIARESIAILNRSGRPNTYPQKSYRKAVEAAGYRITTGQLAGQQLARDLGDFYGMSFLEQVGCAFVGTPANFWPALMIRESVPGPFAPLRHILLRTFLKHVSDGEKVIFRRKPGPRPRDYHSLDEQLADSLHKAMGDGAFRTQKITAWDALRKIDAWQSYRHNRRSMPKTKATIVEFRLSQRRMLET